MSTHTPSMLTHHSYWIRSFPVRQRFDKLSGVHKTEIAVLGAGITGLSTAIELLDRGHKVTVLEALVVGGGTTAGSSGHIDAHPERSLQKFLKAHGQEEAREVTETRLRAIDLIERRSDKDCDFRRIVAYQYSEDVARESFLREELDAAKKIGLTGNWAPKIPLPFEATGYEIRDMGRLQTMAYLECLLQIFLDKGGKIFEFSVASRPVGECPTELEVGDGKIGFEKLVGATHCNFTDVMRIYLQTPAYQSYVLAARVKNPCTDALFWDDNDPYFYTRLAKSDDPGLIIVGGCDHRTGAGDTMEAEKCLHDYVSKR